MTTGSTPGLPGRSPHAASGLPGSAAGISLTRADPFAAIDDDVDLLDTLPSDEQLPVYERLHRSLTSALAASESPISPSTASPNTASPHITMPRLGS